MRCPRCRREHDILAYVRLAVPEEFRDELAPVYKCPKRDGGCGFLFAPAESAILESMTR